MQKKVAHFLLLGVFCFALLSCNDINKQASYVLTGNLSGIKGEGVAILQQYKTYMEDTVPFIDGKFKFEGVQNTPELYRLYFIGPNDSLIEQLKSDLLYIENGTIQCSGSYKDLMYYIGNSDTSLVRMSVKGGKLNDIYNAYLNETRFIVNKASVVCEKLENPKVAPENMSKAQLEELLGWQAQLDSLLAERDNIKEKYINKYSKTQLAYDFVFASIARDYHYEEWFDENRAHGNRYPEDFSIPSNEKVEQWISLLKQQNSFSKQQLDTLQVLANECKKLTSGANFIDGMIYTPEGDSLLLGSKLEKGKYTLIDCWASWCHPCRASIPHLKQLKQKYEDENLNILGLSLDASSMKEQWLNAVEKEGMTWPQFQVEFNSKLSKAYNISSIPNIILITPDKKILKIGVRGFDLDLMLKRIYGY